MAGYRLTVRHGSRVDRESFESLDDAVEALRQRAEEVLAEGPLEAVKMLREYEPEVQVQARLELSTGGWARGRDAGVDVMGDGTVVPYRGGIFRRELEHRRGETPYDAVRGALRG